MKTLGHFVGVGQGITAPIVEKLRVGGGTPTIFGWFYKAR